MNLNFQFLKILYDLNKVHHLIEENDTHPVVHIIRLDIDE